MATKFLPVNSVPKQTIEYDINIYSIAVPVGMTVTDLLTPSTWKHHAKKYRPRDLIFADALDGSFDVGLRVVGATIDGVQMRLWPMFGDEPEQQEPVAEIPRERGGKEVPRVEHTPRTKWRVIGLDGNEVARDFETKDAATGALKAYAAVHKISLD